MCLWPCACACFAAASQRSLRGSRSAASAASFRIWLSGWTAPTACPPNRYRMLTTKTTPTTILKAQRPAMPETLTITDNRTGKQYEVPIKECAIRTTDLRQIKAGPDDTGLMTYDPAFLNTAACRSAITYIDGDKGILRYRGYPIEQLAEHCTYLEVAYLILFGELPTESQLHEWMDAITQEKLLHENVRKP